MVHTVQDLDVDKLNVQGESVSWQKKNFDNAKF